MYQLNDIDTWHDHHRQLLREAEEGRLARQLGPTNRKRKRRNFAGAMRRRAALLFSAMGLTMILIAGAAYALDVQCEPSPAGVPCIGTDAPDVMTGTARLDNIVGLDGDDEIHGLAAPDRLTGDGNGTTNPGDDELFGGPDSDALVGGAASDLLAGGEGADNISADFLFNDGTDTVRGGSGNDMVNATEGAKDVIDCGRGSRDRVEFDAGLDKVKNCEIKDAF